MGTVLTAQQHAETMTQYVAEGIERARALDNRGPPECQVREVYLCNSKEFGLAACCHHNWLQGLFYVHLRLQA